MAAQTLQVWNGTRTKSPRRTAAQTLRPYDANGTPNGTPENRQFGPYDVEQRLKPRHPKTDTPRPYDSEMQHASKALRAPRRRLFRKHTHLARFEPSPPEALEVQAPHLRTVAVHDGEGRHVAVNLSRNWSRLSIRWAGTVSSALP